MIECKERKRRESRKARNDADADADEEQCHGVGGHDVWLGAAGRRATHTTSGEDGQCAGTRADGLVAKAIGGTGRHQSGLPLPGECADER